MESQPKNPEFRNNPENFHPCYQKDHEKLNVHFTLCMLALFCRQLITYANSLDPDQDRQNVGSD